MEVPSSRLRNSPASITDTNGAPPDPTASTPAMLWLTALQSAVVVLLNAIRSGAASTRPGHTSNLSAAIQARVSAARS